ncbi:hypothetical protein ZIOFF_041295 [Zingiber officinale]|uniref:Clp R domain-containing protein n=1 Tax=Zingiber officinale TaxID=94328 RepID=A0A8J5L5I1_ZINOF|nr:hypothetical protein ZIOFF_041295 [Zingiber officinale]
MPTPVSNARACLAAETAAALDDAVGVARRRAHIQTTSLHVVYALIISTSSSSGGRGGGGGGSSAPCSILRDALSRARSSAYSARLQFKALELCFGVALDRLPSSNRQAAEGSDDPPVSNSLMAAVKRSQANQRRNPDTFHLYQQQQQTAAAAGGATSFSGVKVELQQLVLAILDDPVVSRVFGDAGFRSMDIKLAILRPPPPILHFPRAPRCPPLFLCNFSSGDGFETALTSKELFFPFSTAPIGDLCSDGGEENCRRIGEILARKKSGQNPMLVGVGAGEAAREFARAVEQKNLAVLPLELRGIEFISIEKEVAELGSLEISTLMEELEKKTESSGVVLNIGDLNRMVEGSVKCDEQESCLVSELTRLLEVYHGRLWLMGWSTTYETYMKFLSKHPMLDKDWDLQLLPITSLSTSLGGCMPRSPSYASLHRMAVLAMLQILAYRRHSLMESFVPFGGFFPTACESKSLFSSVYQSMFCYENCNDKYKQEAAVNIKDHSASFGGQENANMPFWLRKANMVSLQDEHDGAKDKTLSGVKSLDLQRTNKEDCSVLCSATIPNNKKACTQNTEIHDDAETERGIDSYPISACTQNTSMRSKSMSLLGNKDLSRLQIRFSETEQFQRENFLSHQVDDHASPSSVTSIMTDLVLGTPHEPIYNKESSDLQLQKDHSKEFSASWPPKKLHMVKGNDPGLRTQEVHVEEFSSSLPTMTVDIVRGNGPDLPLESFSCSDHQEPKSKSSPLIVTPSFSHISSGCTSMDDKPSSASPATGQTIDIGNYKSFCTRLMNKLGRQEEAISAVSQAIIDCKTGQRRRGGILRGDIWLIFGGPDKIGKRIMALALAEMIYGSKENFVCIDLSCQDIFPCPKTICARQNVHGNGVHFRGKMSVDHIAQELSRKPLSVIFLENVERADLLVQNSLCQAIDTGKFPDSHGRQFSVNNSIFVLAASSTQGQTFFERKDYPIFSEETILDARCWQMKIILQSAPESICIPKSNVSLSITPKTRNDRLYVYSPSIFLSKRKLKVSDGCENGTLQSAKRAHKTAKMFLDLNVPVEELEALDSNSAGQEELPDVEISKAWMEDLFNRVDRVVDFKPFDFDALAEIMLQNVSKTFHSTVGPDCLLEIDPKVMNELLAAAWLLETRGALDYWFDKVLGKSFTEARCTYKLSNNSILRLACDDVLAEKNAPGVLLPSTVIVD